MCGCVERVLELKLRGDLSGRMRTITGCRW